MTQIPIYETLVFENGPAHDFGIFRICAKAIIIEHPSWRINRD